MSLKYCSKARFDLLAGVLLSLTTCAVFVSAQELVVTEEDFAEERVYSPYAGRAYADQVFFGDMHFHTDLSFDAGADRNHAGRA